MSKQNENRIPDFLFEIGTMRNMNRTWHQTVPNTNDTIASHSFEVAIIGSILAKLEKVDENKVIKMCLFHDIAETRVGDLNFINSHYVAKNEEKANSDQLEDLPIKSEIMSLLKELEERKTKESIVAKDADILDQVIMERTMIQNEADLKKWNAHSMAKLRTKSAKEIARKLVKRNPHDWIYEIDKKDKLQEKKRK